MNRSNDGTLRGPRELMVFIIGTQDFCVDIMKVREIRMWPPGTSVANAPHLHVRRHQPARIGSADHRPCGASWLRPTVPTSRHAILVVEAGSEAMGVHVDSVLEILGINRDAIQPAPEVSSEMARRFVDGIVAMAGRLTSLLSLDAVLPAAGMKDAA